MAGDALDLSSIGPNGENAPVDLTALGARPVNTSSPSTVGELGTALARSAFVGLPTTVGKALQFAGADQFGANLAATAQRVGQQPWLQLHPEQHGAALNTVANLIVQSGAFLPAVATAFAPPVSAALGVAGGVAQAGEQGQETKEAITQAGGSEQQAQRGGLMSAGLTAAVNLAGGMVARNLVHAVSNPVSNYVRSALGQEAPNLAGDVLNQLTGNSGTLSGVVRQLPATLAEITGLGAAQAAGTRAIEQSYGVQGGTPGEAALQSIPGSLAAGGLLSLAGLPARSALNSAARERTGILASEQSAPQDRAALATQYEQALRQVNPQAADAFRDNAKTAIANGLPLQVDSRLLEAGAVLPPVVEAPPAPVVPETAPQGAPLGLPNYAHLGTEPMVVFPDGSVSTRIEAENYIKSLPEDQQVAARASMQGYAPVNVPERIVSEAQPIHDQIVAELTQAGETPAQPLSKADFAQTDDGKGLKGQALVKAYRNYLADPHTQIELMRQDADAYQALKERQAAEDAARAAEPNPELNKLPEQLPEPEERLGTQLADALEPIRTQLEAEKAYAALEAEKGRQAEAIANIVKGEQQAQAVEAGTVEPDLNAPKQAPELAQDVETAVAQHAEQTGITNPIRAQDTRTVLNKLTEAINGADTHQAQIDNLQNFLDASKSDALWKERLQAVLNNWQAERPVAETGTTPPVGETKLAETGTEPPVSETKPVETEPSVPGINMPPPAGAPVLGDNTLSAAPEEHALLGENIPRALQTAKSETPNPALIPASGRLSDTMTHLAQNGSEPWVQKLASELAPLTSDVRLSHLGDAQNGLDKGVYNPNTRAIGIYSGGETEHAILHETVHAATEHALSYSEKIGIPRNQYEARLKKAVDGLDSVRREVMADPQAKVQYGLTDVHEFVAELDSNPEFRNFLKTAQKSWWGRTVDAVRNLLGLSADSRSALERAMEARDQLYANLRPSMQFDKSPLGATRVADTTVHNLTAVADKFDEAKQKLSLSNLAREVYQRTLGTWTVDFLVNHAHTVPDWVRTGVAKGIADYRSAYTAKQAVSSAVSDRSGGYVSKLTRLLNATGDSAKWSEAMMRIEGESTIGGFDYKLNGGDNIKADPARAAVGKEYMDQIHREFTQLQKAQPKLAEAIVEGELLNRKDLVENVATLAANLMDLRAGNTRRLEAELVRMDPNDAAYARAQARVADARLESNLSALHSTGLDIMGKDLKTARNPDTAKYADGGAAILTQRLDKAFADARALPQGTPLRDMLGELERMYRAQSANPYFSLGRRGDYFVALKFKPGMDAATQARLEAALKGSDLVLGNLTGPNALDHAFFRVDTMDQAGGLYKKLIAAGGDKVDAPASSAGLVGSKDMYSAAGVTPALRQLSESIDELVSKQEGLTTQQAFELKQSLSRSLLSMLPESAARSAKMQRRGVPGYSADVVGNFARNASGRVQDLSSIYSHRAYSAALQTMEDGVKQLNQGGDLEQATRAQMLLDEVHKRYANDMTKLDNSPINLVNALSNVFYLTASPAYFVRALAQPLHRGIPGIGARYGFLPASLEMAKATATALKVVGHTIASGWGENGLRGVMDTGMRFDDLGLPAHEVAFMQEMHDRGLFNLGQAQQLQHAMVGDTQLKQDTVRLSSMTAQYVETLNRVTAGLAAFRLANRDPKMSREAAADWAAQKIRDSMDDFSTANTARVLGKFGPLGKATPLLTQFMQYQAQTFQQIVRTVHDGYFQQDSSPEGLQRSREAKRELAGLMGTTTMIAGVLGLPFVNALAGAYNWLTKDQDDPSDIRGDVRDFLTHTLGTGMGDVMAHGLGSAVNMDTSTFGLENILPGSEFLADRRLMKDKLESQSQQLLGPALNAGMDLAVGLQKISDGYIVKGIEQMLPSGLKPYYKAAELQGAIGVGGYTDSKGLPLPMDKPTAWETLLQGIGFRSANKALHDERAQEFNLNQQLLQHRRQVIDDEMYKATITGDATDQQQAIQDMMAFNAKNPMQPIRNVGQDMRGRMMQYAMGSMSGLGEPVGRRQMAVAMPWLNYAGVPAGGSQ